MELTTTFVCHECIGEEFLSNEVRDSGVSAQCNFCGEEAASIELDELGEKVHEVLVTHFYQTNSEPEGYEYMLAKEGLWERDGYPIMDAIADVASVSEEVAEAIREYLSYHYDAAGKDSLLAEQPYENEAHYEEKMVDTFDIAESWASFKEHILTRSRYISHHAMDVLHEIFNNLDSLATKDGYPVIREVSSETTNEVIYRARVALSTDKLAGILKGLPASLGAPPHRQAKSGRMNAAGIAVFYGALDATTCVAEVRAPVGSSVVVGEFRSLRPLKILDLNRLQKVYVVGSFFDPNFKVELSRSLFLDRLVNELSSPVFPGSEELDYLPTQVVAEYLSQLDELNLDGVMFKSTQVLGDKQNIVLFNHAVGLEDYELPEGTEIDVSFGGGHPDDYDPTITVWESVPPEKKEPKSEGSPHVVWPFPVETSLPSLWGDIDPTLALDMKGVVVHEVKGVVYECLSVDVHRSRMENKGLEEF